MPRLQRPSASIILLNQGLYRVLQDNNPPFISPRDVGTILLLTLFLITIFSFIVDLNDTVMLLIGEVLIIVPALIYVAAKRLPLSIAFRMKKVSLRTVIATLFLFFPVFVLTDEFDRLMQQVFPMPQDWYDAMTELVRFQTVPQTIMILTAGVLVAALCEEWLFRGLVQQSLEKFRDPAMAMVLSSVFFALIHFNPWTSIQILLLGLVLAYVAWKSGSVLPSMIIHALNNLFSLLMMNISEEELLVYAHDHVRLIWIGVSLVLLPAAIKMFNQSTRSA
ncbi:MAG: CPBP family intramembrane metalloprotease [Calditrichaeota bacterium]|nr:MAG: CPBP family intramembrane metalloprotease [Calditrichota bacterium]